MPLLLIPLVLVVLLVLWLVLLPLSLWQRYRFGRARRMARGWVLSLNAWGLSMSVALFVAMSALGMLWWPDSLAGAGLGLAAGLLLGVAGVWLTRWDVAPQGVFYQPNAWLALLLVAVVAARIVLGAMQVVRYWQQDETAQVLPLAVMGGHAGLLAVAGLLLGYYLAYAWGVKWRVARLRRLQGGMTGR